VTYHGKRDVRVDTVADPTIQEPTDAIVRVTSSGLCGSDLHLYELFGPFIDVGAILGHEPMGIVEAVRPCHQHQGRRPGRSPVQHLMRHLARSADRTEQATRRLMAARP
jgi:threonine dehydrogenase-like Zn-dependent dehydrogenase